LLAGDRIHVPGCPLTLSRRRFLRGMSVSVLAAKMGLLDCASSLLGAEDKPAGRPTVAVVFIRPKTSDPERLGERPIISWPGGQFDIKAGEALHKKVLTGAARTLGVGLEIRDEPLAGVPEIDAYIEHLKKAPPDGLFIVAMELFRWNLVNHLVKNRGDIPTIVYSPMGSSFTQHLKAARSEPKTFVGATQDVQWPAFGLRMLSTIWRMKHTRLCILKGNKTADQRLDPLGTTLHYIPLARFNEAFETVEASDEVRALADAYAKAAAEVVEPKKAEILDAAKNYVVCRRLMAAENCQGISVDCLRVPGIYRRPPCMAFSHLLDEGVVAACEADTNAAISMLLVHLLFERPGFMQDPAPNTINNTLMGAHCTSATRLEGFAKGYRAPFRLRSYHTRTGVALQVLWRIGQKVTIMKFQGPGSIILGTGRVVANIAQPPAGCCRTAVEIELDGVPDSGETKGFHQLFIYGDLERPFKAYCRLAGIKAEHI
jgi:uncharacterized short protein YbdD (DUF466 family)